MKIVDVFEARNPVASAVKLWLKISDLLVDLEDELLELSKTNPRAQNALQYLRNNDFHNLHQELRKMMVF